MFLVLDPKFKIKLDKFKLKWRQFWCKHIYGHVANTAPTVFRYWPSDGTKPYNPIEVHIDPIQVYVCRRCAKAEARWIPKDECS